MESWDVSKATVARIAGLGYTRWVCLFHDNDQENEALGSGQLSAVCSTDLMPCESFLLSPKSQYRPHRTMAVQTSCSASEPYHILGFGGPEDSLFYTQAIVKVKYVKTIR